MLIGKKGTEGNFKARFDNEQLAFLEGDNVVTWISNRTFHALGMETEGAMNMTNPKVPGKWGNPGIIEYLCRRSMVCHAGYFRQ